MHTTLDKLKRSVPVLAIVSVLAGCARLQPVDLPPETLPAPSQAALWQAVNAATGRDWFALLNDGQTALDWRLRAIDSATQTIELQTFLWSFDTSGSLVMAHLWDAAERGVRIRLLIDDSFLVDDNTQTLALYTHPNIEYRVFNPYQRRQSNVVLREVLNLADFSRLDHRMHNKAMIVDGQVAIVGGRNLADEYFGLHGDANFRDLELLVGGAIVTGIADAFLTYWNDEWSVPAQLLAGLKIEAPAIENARTAARGHGDLHRELTPRELEREWLNLAGAALPGKAALLADEPPGDDLIEGSFEATQLAEQLRALLDEAQEEIIILSAYLIPTPALEETLARAVRRGVDVRLLTNSIRSNNHLVAHSAYRNHIHGLLGSGVQLYEVRIDAGDRHEYMLAPVSNKALALHAKTVVIDDRKVFVGSLNLDPRSMRINTEMALLVESEALNLNVREHLALDFKPSNAWELRFDEQGGVVWVSDTQVLATQPASSFMQDLEDWFLSLLPVEEEL